MKIFKNLDLEGVDEENVSKTNIYFEQSEQAEILVSNNFEHSNISVKTRVGF